MRYILLSAIKIAAVITHRAVVRDKGLRYSELLLTLVAADKALENCSFRKLHVPVSQSYLHHWESIGNTATVTVRMCAMQSVKVMKKIAPQSHCLLCCCQEGRYDLHLPESPDHA